MGTSANAERRDVPRRPFRGTVVLASPAEGEDYEADGVDLSIGGMSLRTEFLPDVNSELECKFVLETGESVEARAEVIWARDAGRDAGAFGLRFLELPRGAEEAIRESIDDGDDAAVVEAEARAPVAAPPKAAASVPMPKPAVSVPMPKPAASADDDPRAKLFIPGMDAPLRARVRTHQDDVLVVGSDLSFLKLGQRLEVERDGERTSGHIEDVNVEIDPRTNIARLVLTLALGDAAVTTRPDADPPRSASKPTSIKVSAPVAAPTPTAPLPLTSGRRKAAPPAAVEAAPAPARAVVGTAKARYSVPPVLQDPDAPDDYADAANDESYDAGTRHDDDTAHADDDAAPAQTPARAAPPWLVATIRGAQQGGSAAVGALGPMMRRLTSLVAAVVALCVAKLRGQPVAPAAPAAGRGAPAPGLRKQQQSQTAPAVAEPASAESPRRKMGLYVLAAAGLGAIALALISGNRAPRPQTPRPQVAVPETTGAEATTDPAATTEPGALEPTSADMAAEPPPVAGPTRAPTVARSPVAGPRPMPVDLVGAARSRNANPMEAMPSIRVNPQARPTALRVAARPAGPAAPTGPAAPATPPAAANALGSPSLTSGTVLRLRMDGPVTALTGGTAPGNALVIRMAGRRPLDMAAPLVRQDARLATAGVYIRPAGAELILRFHDTPPAFSVRGRGNTLEIVLASPALVRRPTVIPPRGVAPARVVAPVTLRSGH